MIKEIDIDRLNRILSGNYDEGDLKYFENLFLDDTKVKALEKYLYKQWNDLKKEGNIKGEEKLRNLLFAIHDKIDYYENSKSKIWYNQVIYFYKSIAALLVPLIIIFSVYYILNSKKSKTEEFVEIKTNKGSKTNFILPDGTIGWLNSNSIIRYASDFKSSRRIYLNGEAFFDVKHLKKRPFYVITDDIKIKVIGTRFNVKAYPEDKKVEATLIRGKLEIELPDVESKTKKIYLRPNQKFVYDKNIAQKPLLKEERIMNKNFLKVNKVENLVYDTAWIVNKLIFKNEPFNSLILKLERWYNVEIKLTDSTLVNYSYTGSFENETIEQALTALKLANPVFDYKMEKNKIEIYSINKIIR